MAPSLLPTGIISLAQSAGGFVAIAGGADGVNSVALTGSTGAALVNAHSGLFTLDGTEILLSSDTANPNLVLGKSGTTLALAIFIDPATGTVSVADYVAIQHPVSTDPDDGVTMAGVVFVTVTDNDGDPATTSSALSISIRDDGPTVGVPAATTALESDLTSLAASTTHGSLDVSFGTDGPGAVYFTSQLSAIAIIHAVDDQNHAIDISHLT